jgi:predicted transcriptional regulator
MGHDAVCHDRPAGDPAAPGTADAGPLRGMEHRPVQQESVKMNLQEVREILEARVLVGSGLEKIEVRMGCGADLMSDVLAFTKTGALLLTGLTNAHVIRTSDMVDIKAICFVRGKLPLEETVRLAEEGGLPLLTTELPMFEACGRLYREGLKGCSEGDD